MSRLRKKENLFVVGIKESSKECCIPVNPTERIEIVISGAEQLT